MSRRARLISTIHVYTGLSESVTVEDVLIAFGLLSHKDSSTSHVLNSVELISVSNEERKGLLDDDDDDDVAAPQTLRKEKTIHDVANDIVGNFVGKAMAEVSGRRHA